MILFYDQNGKIIGYQTYPAEYSGAQPNIVVPDGTSLEGKKVVNGQLTGKTQQELSDESTAAANAARSVMVVSKRQAFVAMHNAGVLATVQAAVDATGGLLKIEFDTAAEFKRLNPAVLALASGLGWSDDYTDALFEAAAQVPQ